MRSVHDVWVHDNEGMDEEFIAAVAAMPEASGVALGFDRLVMLAAHAPQISDVIWTPVPIGARP